jgi:hypothetical protein
MQTLPSRHKRISILAALAVLIALFAILTSTTSYVYAAETQVNFGTDNDAGLTLGTSSSNHAVYPAQVFTPAISGILTEIGVYIQAGTGSPTGDIDWFLYSDGTTEPDTLLDSDSWTPSLGSLNVIEVTAGYYVSSGVTYWLVFGAHDTQPINTNWQIQVDTGDNYASGAFWWSVDDGSTWSSPYTGNADIRGYIKLDEDTPTATPTPTITPTPHPDALQIAAAIRDELDTAPVEIREGPSIEIGTLADDSPVEIVNIVTFGDLAIVSVNLAIICLLFILLIMQIRTRKVEITNGD